MQREPWRPPILRDIADLDGSASWHITAGPGVIRVQVKPITARDALQPIGFAVGDAEDDSDG